MATKARMAKGNRYTTTDQSRGAKTIPMMNTTLTVMARARGMASSCVSALDDRSCA